MTSDPEDPRIEGFVRAVSTYTGIPVAELKTVLRAADQGPVSPILDTAAGDRPSIVQAAAGPAR
jgi:hypothetical protein